MYSMFAVLCCHRCCCYNFINFLIDCTWVSSFAHIRIHKYKYTVCFGRSMHALRFVDRCQCIRRAVPRKLCGSRHTHAYIRPSLHLRDSSYSFCLSLSLFVCCNVVAVTPFLQNVMHVCVCI